MFKAGIQSSPQSRRLPALYLSCRKIVGESLQPLPLMGRLLEATEKLDALIFITSSGSARSPEVRCNRPENSLVDELQSLLEHLGHLPTVHQTHDKPLSQLAAKLFAEPMPEIIEIRLGPGMAAGQYRRLGASLCHWRERQVMPICVDQLLDELGSQLYTSAYDPYWRRLLNKWVEERNWVEALSCSTLDEMPSITSSEQAMVGDNALCLMHTAFGLGGLRVPERLFGFDLDDSQQALSGYCWMN